MQQAVEGVDHRGQMVRGDRQMSDEDTREYLRQQCFAHVGTSDASGWPYVVPLMYVYEGGNVLYLHTGPHQGHFLANVRENSRICIQVNEGGQWHPSRPTAFDSSLVYKSAIVFGRVRIVDGPGLRDKKLWFFDNLLQRLKDDKSNYERPYPERMLESIILFEVEFEIVTGKRNVVLHH